MKTRNIVALLASLGLVIAILALRVLSHAKASSLSHVPTATALTADAEVPEAPELHGYKQVQAERMPLAIHGPFIVTMEETARKKTERRRPLRDTGEEDFDGDALRSDKTKPACTSPAACGGAAGGDGPAKNIETPSMDQTWDAVINRGGSGGGSDPQIAAGPTYLLTTMRDEITFLDKNGNVVNKDKNGRPINGQIQTIDFFGKLTDDINLHLNLPGQFPVSQYGIDTYYDARTIYDSYRQRYWIVALAINNKTPCARQLDVPGAVCKPLLSGARRAKLVVGVSSTNDPRDNWILYWWDAVAHDGQCGVDPVCLVTEHGADYPSLGISEKYLLEENAAAGDRYITIAPADALANGGNCTNCNFAGGWAYWHIKAPDGAAVNPGESLQPALHHGRGYPNWSFFAATYHDKGQSYQISIVFVDAAKSLFYATSPIKSYAFPANAPQPPAPPRVLQPFLLRVANVGNSVMKAIFRDGKLYTTFEDCALWPGTSQCITSIRVLRIDVTNPAAKPEIDRTFGQRNINDPAKVNLVTYATPALEVNKDGNIAVVYLRSAANLFPEARYSVYSANAPDISPSKLLRAGASTYWKDDTPCVQAKGAANCPTVGNLDVGGISVDGGDDKAVWMAHGYVDSSGTFKIAVGRIFGSTKIAGN